MRPTDVATFISRFVDKVEFTDECWLWTGSLLGPKYIYGQMKFGGKKYLPHRLSYIWFNNCGKTLSRGLEVHHLCRVKLCVNPDHLLASTPTEHRRLENGPYCPEGHLKDYDNLRTDGSCKICNRIRSREHMQRRRSL